MNKTIETHTGNVYYEDTGNGFSLVFLHGLCEDGYVWKNFIPELEESFRILRPDFPGCGQSSLNTDPSSMAIDDYAEVVFEILNKEKIKECVIIGHSMGGYAALAFAEKYPEFLKGLCLFHSSAFADDENKKADRLKAIDFISRKGSGDFIDQLYKNNFTENFYQNNFSAIKEFVERAKKFPKEGAIASLHAMMKRPERLAVLRNARFPVQFIIGKRDKVIPLEKSLQQCHLPKISSILILNEAAHMGMFEAMEECRAAILECMKLIS